MDIRNATINDIDKLIQIRLDYLREDKGQLTEYEENTIRTQLVNYYQSHINKDFIAVLGEVDHTVVSSAFLVISEKPANPSFITGKTGLLLNVFTYPEFRRNGFAEKIIHCIINEAKDLELSYIELSATPQGYPLYKKLGFIEPESKHTSMRLQLI